MAKLLRNIGTKKRRFLINLHVAAVEFPLNEPIHGAYVEFIRGKDISRSEQRINLEPSDDPIPFNESFNKESIFYLNEKKKEYFKKIIGLKLKASSD